LRKGSTQLATHEGIDAKSKVLKMQGNPPQDLLPSVESISDDADIRSNHRVSHTDKESKSSRASAVSPRKLFTDGAMFTPSLNRRHGFMEFSSAKSTPRHAASRSLKEASTQDQSHISPAEKRDESVNVAQLNTLLHTSITRLSSLETEKNDRYERWKQEVGHLISPHHIVAPLKYTLGRLWSTG
jgi:hypothetical protein